MGIIAHGHAEHRSAGADCTGIEDFKACLGNTENFCPANVSCQCKDEKPFCRCDYFRVDWIEYWYMGPKCNHLWNTVDFILVTILPAVALVIIVIVVFYSIYYCKSKKTGNRKNPAFCEAQRNPAFTAEPAGNLGRAEQQLPRDAWVGQIPKAVVRSQDFAVPTPSQLESYSPVYPQPSRRPDTGTDHFSNPQPEYDRFSYRSNNLPYGGYAEGRQYQKY
ncbi:uncharacterized protein O9250_006456 [Rhynochetos jubatus]